MAPSFSLALPVVVAAGAAIAFQAPINAALGRLIGGTVPAAAVSFGVGFLALLLMSVLLGGAGAYGKLGVISWWHLLGGVLGAIFVWASLWGVPTLGVVTMVAALILGQLIAGLAIDAMGPFGLPVQSLTPQRLLAVGLVAIGLVLSRY